MAVELLTFPSLSAQIHKGGDGGLDLVSIHEYVKGIDQCQTFLRSADVNQNGEDFHCEVDRVLKNLLLKSQLAEFSESSPSQSQIKDLMARPSTHDVDIEFSRNDQSELAPVLTCGEGDGGHRCPYFPCPYCHRSRSIFGPESKHNFRHSQNYDCKSTDHHTLMGCEEDEVVYEETPLVSSHAYDMQDLCDRVNDQSVPVLTCGEGDGGHRCPYFPCPYCHRSRSITGIESDYNVDSPYLDCKSDRSTLTRCEEDIVTSQVLPRPNAHVEYLTSRIDDQLSAVSALTCPDGGHKCPYFPCPICHRTRRFTHISRI